jgi:hypothetical protein
MIFISIFLILLLLGAALWLWYLGQAQLARLDVLMDGQGVTVHPTNILRSILSYLVKLCNQYTIRLVIILLLTVIIVSIITVIIVSIIRLFVPHLFNTAASAAAIVLPVVAAGAALLGKRGYGTVKDFVSTKGSTSRRTIVISRRSGRRSVEIHGTTIGTLASAISDALSPPRMARYSGMANLPKKVYEGDSQNITLILNQKGFVPGLHPEVSHVQEITENKQTEQQITLDIQEKDSSEQFLEVRLLAAAFPTKGEEKQRQSLARERLEYRWNCYFQTAGQHELALELKVIHLSDERSLGAIEQHISVVKLDHMTRFHVQAAAVLIGTMGFVSTVVMIISNIQKLRIP